MIKKSLFVCLMALFPGLGVAQLSEAQHLIFLILKDSFDGWKPKSPAETDQLKLIATSPDFKTHCLPESVKKSGAAVCRFHWVDLNQDSVNDIIYSGGCMPYAETELFLFKDGGYIRVTNMGGEVINLKKSEHYIKVYTRSEGCCCDFYSGIGIAKILPGSHETEISSLLWHVELEMDSVTYSFEPFETMGRIALRTHPRINNKIRLWECNDDFKIFGNRTIQFNQGVSGYILYRKKVKGKTWGLVLIMPNGKHIKTSFEEQYFDPHKTYSLGWTEINENLRLTSK